MLPNQTSRANQAPSCVPAGISAGSKELESLLALGGGFSRGFAHLGVLEVLEQEHIRCLGDRGNKYWRPAGSGLCRRHSPFVNSATLAGRFEFATLSAFSGPAHSTPGNDRIGQFVREWFHASRVEELCIPTAIVTTDIDTCAPYVFTRGPLEVAIRATCAFPGLFKPVGARRPPACRRLSSWPRCRRRWPRE